MEEFDTARWSDGTEMVTLYSHLTSVLWGVCKGFQARLDEVAGPAGAKEQVEKTGFEACSGLPASREP